MSLIICIIYLLGSFVYACEYSYNQLQNEIIKNNVRLNFGGSFTLSNPGSIQQVPDIFKAITDPEYAGTLSAPIQNFIRIFYEGFSAYWTDFRIRGIENFELLNWSQSPILQSMSFDFHLHVIQQIIDHKEILSKEFGHEFIKEYLEYAFSRSSSNVSCLQYTNLLKSAIIIVDSRLFSLILKYVPHNYSQNYFICELWEVLIKISVDKSLFFESKAESEQTRHWLKMYYLLSLQFGACDSLRNLVIEAKESEDDYSKIFEMDDDVKEREDLEDFNMLINSQPLFAAFIKHDARGFNNYLTFKAKLLKPAFFFYYLNLFIYLDQDIKHFNPEKECLLEELADSLFISLNWKLEGLTELCFKYSYNSLIQFLLIHSAKARSSIPSKQEQCRILSNMVKKSKFDGQSIKLAWIAAFHLTLTDLQQYLLVQRDSEMIRVLLYLMKIVDSAPQSIDNWTNWNFPVDSPFPEMKKLVPYIYEAGRILLARHFKILPVHAQVFGFFREEYCFRDLQWFLNILVSKFRPDLTNFETRINVFSSLSD